MAFDYKIFLINKLFKIEINKIKNFYFYFYCFNFKLFKIIKNLNIYLFYKKIN